MWLLKESPFSNTSHASLQTRKKSLTFTARRFMGVTRRAPTVPRRARTDRVHLDSGHTGQTSPGADLNLHRDTPTRANLAFSGPSESSTGHFSKKQKDDSLRRRKRRAFSRGKSKEALGRITHSRAVATDASWQGRRTRRGRQPAAGRSWSLGWGGIR